MDGTFDWSRYNDVAGQLPSLQGYTQFCLFFTLRDTSSDSKEIVTKLMQSTAIKLSSMFTWLSGQVANEGSTLGNSGVFKIMPYRQTGTGFDILVRDHLELDYEDFVRKRVPMGMLDGDIFSPKRDLTLPYDLANSPVPVLVLQINYLKGGTIMTFAAAHNAMDMTGLGIMIKLFGKICRGDGIDTEEVEWGNISRRNLVKLLGPGERKLDHGMLAVDPEQRRQNAEPAEPAEHSEYEGGPPATIRWAYVRFTREKLALLKELAIREVYSNPLVESSATRTTDASSNQSRWLSTDDAVSAFLWQRITVSRLSRLLSRSMSPPKSPEDLSNIKSIFCRAVNGRRLFEPPIAPSYMGQMVTCTYNSLSLQALTAQPLSTIAQELRKSLDQQDDHSIRSFLTFIDSHTDKGLVNFAARMDLSRDVLISSGAGLEVYHVDFGPCLGFPECVRRSRWATAEGVIYLMPKTRDGDVDAAICLRNDDWEKLSRDKTWNEFGDYIG